MDGCFVDSDRGSPGTPGDPSLYRPSSSGDGRPATSLSPAEPPAQPTATASGFPLSDQVYLGAGAIFRQLRKDRPITHQLLHYGKKEAAALPEGLDQRGLRLVYQLAFNTLKYQDLLEDIILDTCFHTSQQIPDDLLPVAMVMLFDLQDRKFQLIKCPAKKGEEPQQDVRDLESCFRRSKTKLAASLARSRVKQNLVSVSCVLPDPVRTNQNRARLLPFHAWVNTLTSSMEDVCEELQADMGLREVESLQDCQGELDFCRDALCPDTLCFPPQLHAVIEHSVLATGHVLHTQHIGVCVAVSALRPHLRDHIDVLVAGSFSACTLAQIAVHAAARSGKVLVCGGDHTPSQREEMQELLAQMDIKNVRVSPGDFQGLDEWDSAAQRLRLILLLPQCSCSALSDPVPSLVTEHGDIEVLQDLSQGPVSQSKLDSLVHHQEKLLAHALTFPKVQTVFYCTRSVYPQENEHLVRRALDKTDTPPKLLPFRPARPLLPQSPGAETADSPFLKIEPSGCTDGCFIARLTRESDAVKVDSVQDVLARAAAKGLLGAAFGDQSQPGQRAGRRKGGAPAANHKPYSPLPGPAEAEPVDPDPGADRDPASGHAAPSVTESGGGTEDRAADDEDEEVEEGNKGVSGGRHALGKGRRKGKGGARRQGARGTVSAAHPSGAGRRMSKVKVKPTTRQGPKRRTAAKRFTPAQLFTPPPGPPAPPTTSTGRGGGGPPISPTTHVLQVSHKKDRGQETHAKQKMKKVAEAGVSTAMRAASPPSEGLQDPPPVDFLQPLVSSLRASSLSVTSASSQSRVPSSSTMSSTPTSTTQKRMLF